jgi:hypothetical protein
MALRSFYRLVVIGTLSILAIFAALDVRAILCGYDTAQAIETWPLLVLAIPVLICSFFAIGITVLWFGMILDCALISKLPIWSKVIWLVLLVLTNAIGALIYYFCVYKNRPIQRALAEENLPTQT